MAKRKKATPQATPAPASDTTDPKPKRRKAKREDEVMPLELAAEPPPEPPVEPVSAPETASELEHRHSVRRPLRVPTVVQFKESEENTWKEMTEITTVSKTGAGLVLSRECPVGRLVSLVMQMPPDLRLYDHYAPVYPMLGVVQNCYAATVDGKHVYHVGVAFIGKKIPTKAKADPRQCYRLTRQNRDGLWEVVEAANEFQSRKHSRFWRRLEVNVALRDEKTRTSRKATVVTRDVSSGGMAVFGPLDANIGDRVKVTSKEHEFYAMARVRNRTDREDESQSLVHMEFDGAEFPVWKISMQPEVTDLRQANTPASEPPDGDEDESLSEENGGELVRY